MLRRPARILRDEVTRYHQKLFAKLTGSLSPGSKPNEVSDSIIRDKIEEN